MTKENYCEGYKRGLEDMSWMIAIALLLIAFIALSVGGLIAGTTAHTRLDKIEKAATLSTSCTTSTDTEKQTP